MIERTVFLIDDQLPVVERLVSDRVYDGPIAGSHLQELLLSGSWKELTGIKWCLERLLETPFFLEGRLHIVCFKEPELTYRTLESGIRPDVVIFDWEYGAPNATQSGRSLLQLLEGTDAMVFVYSKVRDGIPPTLNTEKFVRYFDRLQLLAKDKSASFFSPEERIFQYVTEQFASDRFTVFVDKKPVEFVRGKLLSSSSDLLFIGRLVGAEEARDRAVSNQRIDDAWAMALLTTLQGGVAYDPSTGTLRDVGQQKQLTPRGSEEALSYAEVAARFSLLTLENVLERGVATVGSHGSVER